MTLDASVTAGHPLYCVHRFREQVRHMVIFDRFDDSGGHERTRLYLTDEEYSELLKEAESGSVDVISHSPVIAGHIIENNGKIPKTPKRKKAKLKRRIRK